MGFWNIRDRFFDLSSDNAYIFKFQQNAFFYFVGFFLLLFVFFLFCFVFFKGDFGTRQNSMIVRVLFFLPFP